jgi:hypothetical protein
LQDIKKVAISGDESTSACFGGYQDGSGTKEDHKNAATALQYCPDDGKPELTAKGFGSLRVRVGVFVAVVPLVVRFFG